MSLFARPPTVDAEAFEREALPHLDSLYRAARRMCRNDRDAEDLVQETMARALRFFHRFRPGTNCRAWLMQVLRNIYINDWHRRERAPLPVPLDTDEDLSMAFRRHDDGAATSPEEELMTGVWDAEIVAALDRLPDDFRVVVVLCDVEEFSYREIAGILGIPIGTVRSRLARARRILQKSLLAYAGKPVHSPEGEAPDTDRGS